MDQLAALSAAGLLVTVPATVGAFFWRRGTAAGAMASTAGGALAAVLLLFGLGVGAFDPRLALGVAAVSAGLFVGVSLLTRPYLGALDFAGELGAELDRHGAW